MFHTAGHRGREYQPWLRSLRLKATTTARAPVAARAPPFVDAYAFTTHLNISLEYDTGSCPVAALPPPPPVRAPLEFALGQWLGGEVLDASCLSTHTCLSEAARLGCANLASPQQCAASASGDGAAVAYWGTPRDSFAGIQHNTLFTYTIPYSSCAH